MVTLLIISCISLLIAVLFLLYKYKRNTRGQIGPEQLNPNSIIQKSTHLFFFSSDGRLLSQSVPQSQEQVLLNFKIGDHISVETKFKNIEKYFESSLKFKKNISVKLLEESNYELFIRHDIIFTPVLSGNEVTGVILVCQEMVSNNNEKVRLNAQKKIENERNFAFKQIEEIEAKKNELELAFKKSSVQHIILQKALLKNEQQNDELEKALATISFQKLELEKANKEIQESSRLKELFLANTSHEIRTPLNAIIGFTNLLLSSDLTENQFRYLDNIKSSGNNLLVVINDILDFSKIESGKLTLEQIDFNFRDLIKHTLNIMAVKAQEKDIEIKYDVSPEIPELITGDPVRLNQILTNLIGNSLKFNNPGGWVRVIATNGKMTNDSLKLLFKIEDNGIGISPEKLSYIFQSFTQGESDTTRKYGGTGLGLSIVKQLIELHEGEIEVESETGKGTAFTFYIKLKVPNNSAFVNDFDDRKMNLVEKVSSNNLKILLVEDNYINQQMAIDTIMVWNDTITVEIAENGKIALEKVVNEHFDLILMDIQMPIMDGNEATQKIRELPAPKNQIPIVAITAHALKDEKEKCLNIGMNDYLSKPFNPEELYNKIRLYTSDKFQESRKFSNESNSDSLDRDSSHDESYEFFNTDNLRKIYQDNFAKISKIIGMCRESIPNELIEIQNAYNLNDWESLRNKAHALKPKLGYLGMLTQQENAKNIEILSQQPEKQRVKIQELISQIKNYWEKATPELLNYITQHAEK